MNFLNNFRNVQETKDPYGAPGTGASTLISVVTIVAILGAWWLITYMELIRPLFLPSPEMVFSKFLKISCYNHYSDSLFVVLGLLVLGGGLIQDFALALTIGIVVGTYSSMYVASPVVVFLDRIVEAKKVEQRSAPETA